MTEICIDINFIYEQLFILRDTSLRIINIEQDFENYIKAMRANGNNQDSNFMNEMDKSKGRDNNKSQMTKIFTKFFNMFFIIHKCILDFFYIFFN